MMETTMSRVCLCICGAALLAAVISPVSAIYEDDASEDMLKTADGISSVLDSFWYSEVNDITLRLGEFLPSPEATVSIDGHNLSLFYKDKEYKSLISAECCPLDFGYGDILKFTRDDGKIKSI